MGSQASRPRGVSGIVSRFHPYRVTEAWISADHQKMRASPHTSGPSQGSKADLPTLAHQRRHPRLPQGTVGPSVPQPCCTEHQMPAGTGQLCMWPGPSFAPLDAHPLCTLRTTSASRESRQLPEILLPFHLALSLIEPIFQNTSPQCGLATRRRVWLGWKSHS